MLIKLVRKINAKRIEKMRNDPYSKKPEKKRKKEQIIEIIFIPYLELLEIFKIWYIYFSMNIKT
jgi:hypothetical protein